MPRRYQQEILRFLSLGPELMDQIGYWLKHGKVAKDKIGGDLISGYRSALSWNLTLLMKDLSMEKMNVEADRKPKRHRSISY